MEEIVEREGGGHGGEQSRAAVARIVPTGPETRRNPRRRRNRFNRRHDLVGFDAHRRRPDAAATPVPRRRRTLQRRVGRHVEFRKGGEKMDSNYSQRQGSLAVRRPGRLAIA